MRNFPEMKPFIDRIIAKRWEQVELNGEIREIYNEAKAAGADKVALSATVSNIMRRQKAEKAGQLDLFEERADSVGAYLQEFYGTEIVSE